ncbi:unnamed protein product [Orchesella dallaii]|uniref:Uncharacterized protein n=1 Tax=Orchesella dallaii TaxID=48710 RepID=A0ABP1PJL6_9HEXA
MHEVPVNYLVEMRTNKKRTQRFWTHVERLRKYVERDENILAFEENAIKHSIPRKAERNSKVKARKEVITTRAQEKSDDDDTSSELSLASCEENDENENNACPSGTNNCPNLFQLDIPHSCNNDENHDGSRNQSQNSVENTLHSPVVSQEPSSSNSIISPNQNFSEHSHPAQHSEQPNNQVITLPEENTERINPSPPENTDTSDEDESNNEQRYNLRKRNPIRYPNSGVYTTEIQKIVYESSAVLLFQMDIPDINNDFMEKYNCPNNDETCKFYHHINSLATSTIQILENGLPQAFDFDTPVIRRKARALDFISSAFNFCCGFAQEVEIQDLTKTQKDTATMIDQMKQQISTEHDAAIRSTTLINKYTNEMEKYLHEEEVRFMTNLIDYRNATVALGKHVDRIE